MSDLIYLGAEFNSYTLFRAAFDGYCRQNAVNGIPLKFVRQSSELLKTDSFKGEFLNEVTINQFKYRNLALVCTHRERKGVNGFAVKCHGRITIRFDKMKKLILVSSFQRVHSNHPNQGIRKYTQRLNRNDQNRGK